MIAYVEVPPEVTRIDELLKPLAARITEQCAAAGKGECLGNATDLFSATPEGWVFIRSGVFKYYFGNRLIRLYSAGDLLPVVPVTGENGCRCISEFGAEITVFEAPRLGSHFREHPEDAQLLLGYQALHGTLLHILCSAFMNEDLQPDLSIRSYPAGTVIIAQGDPAHEIFQMIQGDAIVTVNGVEVGNVAAGEVFGEISFFVESTRSATVTAQTECVVQIMGKKDFITFTRIKPSVNFAISKTLSQRLLQTNKKIAG